MTIEGLVWADYETGGLAAHAPVLEVAYVITDPWGKVCETYDSIVLPLPVDQTAMYIRTLESAPMGSSERYVYEMHDRSGLWQEVLDIGVPTTVVEQELFEWLTSHEEKYNLNLGDMPLCGNSVWADHAWMNHSFPKVGKMFNHRNIDVSSTKELVKRRNPRVADEWKEIIAESFKPHRAMDDIKHSIAEFIFYTEQGVLG